MNLYDPIVEYGHKEFNDLMVKYYDPDKVYFKSIDSLYKKSKLLYYIKCFYNHFRLALKSKQGDVFLVFNTPCLYFLLFFKKFIGISFFVHNNLDFAHKSRVHSFMYARIAKKVNLIYLEDRLKQRAQSKFLHLSCLVVNHPLIKVRGKQDISEKKVFVSSRNLNVSDLILICDFEKDSIVLCNKQLPNIYRENLQMGFIVDFDNMLLSISKLYLLGDYKYRASGILYKVMMLDNVEIIVSDKQYFKEIQSVLIENRINNSRLRLM